MESSFQRNPVCHATFKKINLINTVKNINKFVPQMRRKYNLEERKQHYIKTRERIFGSANELKRTISKKILKLRTKFCRKEKNEKTSNRIN